MGSQEFLAPRFRATIDPSSKAERGQSNNCPARATGATAKIFSAVIAARREAVGEEPRLGLTHHTAHHKGGTHMNTKLATLALAALALALGGILAGPTLQKDTTALRKAP